MSIRRAKKLLGKLSNAKEKDVLKVLRVEERELLAKLQKYHHLSALHCLLVAKDCVYVARKMGLSGKEEERLFVAGLLHDVGKIHIKLIVLEEGVPIPEARAIAKQYGVPLGPKENPLDKVTMRQLVEFRHKHYNVFRHGKHLSARESRELMQALEKTGDIDISIMQHIKRHQEFTEKILRGAGVAQDIINIAARHHPEYLTDHIRTQEMDIISAVDKFNGMIQSEGYRPYDRPKLITEALDLLLRNHIINREVLKILGYKYLPYEQERLQKLVIKDLRRKKTTVQVIERLVLFIIVAQELEFPSEQEQQLLGELEEEYEPDL